METEVEAPGLVLVAEQSRGNRVRNSDERRATPHGEQRRAPTLLEMR